MNHDGALAVCDAGGALVHAADLHDAEADLRDVLPYTRLQVRTTHLATHRHDT